MNLLGSDGNNPAVDVVRNRGDARKLRTRTAVAVREAAAVDYFSHWTCSVCKPEAMSSTIPIMSRATTPAIVSAQNHEDVALSSAAGSIEPLERLGIKDKGDFPVCARSFNFTTTGLRLNLFDTVRTTERLFIFFEHPLSSLELTYLGLRQRAAGANNHSNLCDANVHSRGCPAKGHRVRCCND